MDKLNFNKNWKVWKDFDPFELVFRVPDDALSVDLPYDAMLCEQQNDASTNGGYTGSIDAGEYKYYKKFFMPEEYKNGHVILQFEGIYQNSSIFINQSKIGGNAYGYTDFMAEAGDYLKYGEENEILVTVKCGAKNSRWYSGAGIYRDVYLIHGGSIYVKPYGLRFTTLETDEEGALVCISARIHNDSLSAGTYQAVITVYDMDSRKIVENTYTIRINSRSILNFRKNVYIDHAKLWDDRNPNLYKVEFTISDGKCMIDRTDIVSGIRSLCLDSRHGLRVNGRTVKLRGACIHHDQGILGAAVYDDYEYRRIKRLKDAGFNAVRSAHNPASQALLRACDKLGVYVMDELTDVWNKSKVSYDYSVSFHHNWEEDLAHMVDADYNHPSVVLYSTGNEIFEICSEKGLETSRMLSDKFHELDATRYTTNGINGAFAAGDGLAEIVDDITNGEADTGKGDVNVFMAAMEQHMPQIVTHPIISGILEKLETTMDLLGYNYMTARYLDDAEKYADRIMVGTETYPKQIAENWNAVKKCPAVIGDFTWTGWDYLGEVGAYPELMNLGGDLSIFGRRRPVSYYREIVFGLTQKPCIAVQDPAVYGRPRKFGPWKYTDCTFNYSYAGQEGKPVMIQVYGGGDSVELFLNGKSLGIHPCGKETGFETQYDILYEPGELMAVAYEDGKELGRNILKSAGRAQKIVMEIEKYEVLAFINIDIADEDGILVADAQLPLVVTIEGAAQLLAFAGINAQHNKGFCHTVTTTGEGHALAILKMEESKGEKIKINISGEGLIEAFAEI